MMMRAKPCLPAAKPGLKPWHGLPQLLLLPLLGVLQHQQEQQVMAPQVQEQVQHLQVQHSPRALPLHL
jgi:hypothetical protein